MSSGISIISNSLFQYGEQFVDRLQTMTVFVAVAEEAGFAAAAGRLNMSPPSVTRAVSELETRLGARLLHRTTRSVRLTESGHRYLADCRRILSEIDEAERHAAGVHATPRGMVSVSASALSAVWWSRRSCSVCWIAIQRFRIATTDSSAADLLGI
jgi:DNA-binding transcriptional LysR family regulator